MRRIIIFLVLSISFTLKAHDQWHGFCVVERDHIRICSSSFLESHDYYQICNAFAQQEQAYAWKAQFFSDLDFLRSSIPNDCDEVRDNSEHKFFACMAESYCPSESGLTRHNLASRVYAANDQEASGACFLKEESRYMRHLKEQSLKGCYVRISAEENLKN
jgi:hypothetical protein